MDEVVNNLMISLVAAFVAYLKVKSERNTTKRARDIEFALMSHKVDTLDKQLRTVDELKITINALNVSMGKIEAILTVYMKMHDKEHHELL